MLSELPYDAREKIVEAFLADRAKAGTWPWLQYTLSKGPMAARAILGAGSLSSNGDAHRLVAQSLCAARLRERSTWQTVVAELRREWAIVKSQRPRVVMREKIFIASCTMGLVRLVNYYLQKGTDPNLVTDVGLGYKPIPTVFYEIYGRAPILWRAVASGHVGVVEKLIAAGADVEQRPWNIGGVGGDGRNATAPLLEAVKKDSVALVRALLRAKADPDARVNGNARDGSSTALMLACDAGARNSAGIVRALLSWGARAQTMNAYGDTPLSLAKRVEGGDAIVHALIAAGATK